TSASRKGQGRYGGGCGSNWSSQLPSPEGGMALMRAARHAATEAVDQFLRPSRQSAAARCKVDWRCPCLKCPPNLLGNGDRRRLTYSEVLQMSDCIHCDIHELLESRLQNQEVNLAEIAAKVTEVLADLILMAPSDEQSTLMADMLANLGGFLLEKKEAADPTNP